jgi:hypothetical protein
MSLIARPSFSEKLRIKRTKQINSTKLETSIPEAAGVISRPLIKAWDGHQKLTENDQDKKYYRAV